MLVALQHIADNALANHRYAFIDQVSRSIPWGAHLVRKTLKIVLYINVEQPADFIFFQSTAAESVQVSTDGIVETLCRPWQTVQAQTGRCKNMGCLKPVRYRLQCTV